jgi:predicted Zn-dependent protease
MRFAALLVLLTLAGCTPQQALVAALVPQHAVNVMVGNLGRVTESNRNQVAELDRAGRWKELAALADAQLAQDARNADWWLIAGYARSQMSLHAEAAGKYSEVIRLEPDNAAGWHLLAQTHRAVGEPHRAVNVLNSALLALRDSPLTYHLLAESYTDMRRYDEAAVARRRAQELELLLQSGRDVRRE